MVHSAVMESSKYLRTYKTLNPDALISTSILAFTNLQKLTAVFFFPFQFPYFTSFLHNNVKNLVLVCASFTSMRCTIKAR